MFERRRPGLMDIVCWPRAVKRGPMHQEISAENRFWTGEGAPSPGLGRAAMSGAADGLSSQPASAVGCRHRRCGSISWQVHPGCRGAEDGRLFVVASREAGRSDSGGRSASEPGGRTCACFTRIAWRPAELAAGSASDPRRFQCPGVPASRSLLLGSLPKWQSNTTSAGWPWLAW